MSQPVILLDRDGVINEDSDDYIKSASEFKPYPSSIQAISKLFHAGWQVAVISNQSGIGRGLFSEEELQSMHSKLAQELDKHGSSLANIFYCPHKPTDGCDCRKPATGLLRQAEQSLGVALAGSYMVGDSISDVEAALNHGCVPILVRTGKGRKTEQQLSEDPKLKSIAVYDDLAAVVEEIL